MSCKVLYENSLKIFQVGLCQFLIACDLNSAFSVDRFGFISLLFGFMTAIVFN